MKGGPAFVLDSLGSIVRDLLLCQVGGVGGKEGRRDVGREGRREGCREGRREGGV